MDIIAVAKKYIGQHELTGNSGFVNKAFEKQMQAVGWAKGQSWCAYFTELVWKEAFKGDNRLAALDKLFSASATATFANFSHSELFKTGKEPKPGALVVWRYGNGWQGHIGIVSEVVNKTTFKSIEGNTNNGGGREGIQVAEKVRTTNKPFTNSGLNIIGFVYP